MMKTEPETVQHFEVQNPWQTVCLGVRVLGAEIQWNIIRVLREFEIKQLKKRVRQEYEQLGRLHAEHLQHNEETRESERELCQKQIQFLEKEIAFLAQELEHLRASMLQERLQRWNLSA